MKLAVLKKLCDEATPGPWESRMNPWTYRGTVAAKGDHVASTTKFEDSDFIAAAREALPVLIAVAKAAKWFAGRGYTILDEEKRDELRKALSDLEADA